MRSGVRCSGRQQLLPGSGRLRSGVCGSRGLLPVEQLLPEDLRPDLRCAGLRSQVRQLLPRRPVCQAQPRLQQHLRRSGQLLHEVQLLHADSLLQR